MMRNKREMNEELKFVFVSPLFLLDGEEGLEEWGVTCYEKTEFCVI